MVAKVLKGVGGGLRAFLHKKALKDEVPIY